MNLIAAVVLAAVAMLFVAYPLFRPQDEEPAEPSENGNGDRYLEELLSRRDSTYQAIREMDFDHSIGNLSDQDYSELRERLKLQAIGILKEIDEARAGQTVLAAPADRESQIEEGVRKARPRKAAAAQAGAARQLSTCSSCGQATSPKDKFCRHCGAAQSLTCSACGEPYGEGERFCASCGARLKGGRGG